MDRTRTIDILILSIIVALAVASLASIGNIQIDSSTDAFMPQDSNVVRINKAIEEQFGISDSIIVGVMTDHGTVLTPQVLGVVEALTDRFTVLEGVDKVTSLSNTDHIVSGAQGMEVVPLMQGQQDADLLEMSNRLNEWHEVYTGNLISQDRRLTAIIIQPRTGLGNQETSRILEIARTIVGEYAPTGLDFPIVGLPVVKYEINHSMVADLGFLIPIVIVIILLVLFYSFRRLAGVLIPLASLIVAAALIGGLMAAFQITFTMATMLVPVLLLIVGSAYGIHVMSHFYGEVASHTDFIPFEQVKLIIHTVIKRNRLPVIMAGATTAAGFIAQFTSPLAPFRVFGLLSAIGVVLTQIASLIIIPILLRLTYRHGINPFKLGLSRHHKDSQRSRKVFALLERIAIKGALPLTVITIGLAACTVFFIPRIEVGTNMMDFFKKSSRMVQDTQIFNGYMSGSGIMEVMITADHPSGVLKAEFLKKVEEFKTHMENNPAVGKVQTVIPYIKRINKIMNYSSIPYGQAIDTSSEFDFFGNGFSPSMAAPDEEEDMLDMSDSEDSLAATGEDDFIQSLAQAYAVVGPQGTLEELVHQMLSHNNYQGEAFNEIPVDPAKYGLASQEELRDLISQYLVMYAGNLTGFINDALEPDRLLILIQLRDVQSSALREVTQRINRYWTGNLEEGWKYEIGGGDAVSLTLTDLVTQSQIYSLVGSLVIVWILVSLMFRSLMAGTVALIPVMFSLMGVFLFMSVLGIHLDIITSLLAALAIGTSVDYAIHFISAYQRIPYEERRQGFGQLYGTTGKAIIINAASVALGFSGLIWSRFIPIMQMGILFFAATTFAGISSLTVLPMVLHRLQKSRFLGKGETAGKPETLPPQVEKGVSQHE
ncbi:MAG: RND family transporter [Sphaerochaetaceae bacterium]